MAHREQVEATLDDHQVVTTPHAFHCVGEPNPHGLPLGFGKQEAELVFLPERSAVDPEKRSTTRAQRIDDLVSKDFEVRAVPLPQALVGAWCRRTFEAPDSPALDRLASGTPTHHMVDGILGQRAVAQRLLKPLTHLHATATPLLALWITHIAWPSEMRAKVPT